MKYLIPLLSVLALLGCAEPSRIAPGEAADKSEALRDALGCWEEAFEVGSRFAAETVQSVDSLYEGGTPARQLRVFQRSPSEGNVIRELVMTEDEGTAEEDSACRVVDSWTLGGLDGMPVLEAERGLGDLTAQCVSTIDELATETTNGFYEHFSWLGNGASVEGRWLLSTRASDHTAALVRTRYGDESYDVLVVLWAEADGTCVLAAEFGDPVIVAGPDVPHQWDEHFVSVSRPQGDGGDA